MADPKDYPLLAAPHVQLSGNVDQAMYQSFRDQLAAAPKEGMVVVAISTLGGDPEVGRAMGEDIRLIGAYQGRNALFLGKVAVYSAGATFMSYFRRENRFLTKGTRLMLHERRLTQTINLNGPLRLCVEQLKGTLNELEESIRIEEEGFRQLVVDSDVTFETLRERAPTNWYVEADEAKRLGLVLDVI